MPFDLPMEKSSIIKVIGVGGGGSNAVNFMFQQGITDVDFIVCNTDQQSLANSPVPIKLHLGQTLTEGLGAGNDPEKGREAAIENLDDVVKVLENNTKMVFITAGMGGGTGTGAAPVIAKAARELGILTVGIITIPFRFEGKRRIEQAVKGVQEINKYVDSLLVINNERLREIYGDLGVTEAFSKADNVLSVAAKGIAEIITKKGHVNVDFADVKTVMTESGVAILGSAQAEGEERALHAIQEALNSPLLNNNDITGAKNILLNISFGDEDVTVDEIFEITNFVQDAAGNTADIVVLVIGAVKRLNPGQFYEQYINACSREMGTWVRDNFGTLTID
ncbi:MAG: cell division protein FtsZ, partial [Bacteroidetes bacterium]